MSEHKLGILPEGEGQKESKSEFKPLNISIFNTF